MRRFFSKQAIGVADGRTRLLKGKLPSRLLSDVDDIFRNLKEIRGEIWIKAEGKTAFSKSIPQELRQRIRNVIHLT